MKAFFKGIASLDPWTAAAISALTLGTFAFVYVVARFIAEDENA